MKKWLSPEDVAELLQVSRATAYKIVKAYIESGGNCWQPTKRITRVNPEDFERYLNEKHT